MIHLLSTAYMPPLPYMAYIARSEQVMIETKETYRKQTYRNRAVIMTAEGERNLTVPVIRHNHSRTEEVAVDYSTRWNTVHLRTIKAAYSASPYYMYYCDELEQLLMQHYDMLIDLNDALLGWLMAKLKINCSVEHTDSWLGESPDGMIDLRTSISPKVKRTPLQYETYYQVFADRLPFVPNLSIIDLLFNIGPEARDYLLRMDL